MGKKYKRQLGKATSGVKIGQRSNAATEFNPDYSDVKQDLRRIGLLAGSFILLLVLLAVALQFYPLF